MDKRRFEYRAGISRSIGNLALGCALLAGCTASPWASRDNLASKTSTDIKPAVSDSKPAADAKASDSPADAQAMQQVISELQQVGAVDPVAQDKLMADLKKTNPDLWPMVLQQFRAAAAYKRQEEKRETARKSTPNAAAVPDGKGDGKTEANADAKADAASTRHEPVALRPASPHDSAPQLALAADPAGNLRIETSPATSPASVVNANSPTAAMLKGQSQPAPPLQAVAPAVPSVIVNIASNASEPARNPVVTTSYLAPAAAAATAPVAVPVSQADWQSHLSAAISAIESQSKNGGKSEADIALQARLRMLYLLAGRRDDAMRPLPTAPKASQDYWSKQIYGLSTWMDSDRTPDTARRAAETKRILSEALGPLGETAPLAVRNLTFCTAVMSYGTIKAFKSSEFSLGQEVLLYAEVDNFLADPTAKGYHTAVKINYQILDARGQRVADHESALIEEYCQAPRRDFFVSYRLFLPKHVTPGRYNLQLTVEDTLGHKVGQSTIDLILKPE